MRKKSRGTHEKQIKSMSMLSLTSSLTVKIPQYVLSSRLNLNLNQTVILSEKVAVKSGGRVFHLTVHQDEIRKEV
jgi:hypothetical protein